MAEGGGAEDLVPRLKRLLGLSTYEARVYLTLVRHGPLKPRDAARLAGVPPQRVYDVLEALFSKGLVSPVEGGVYAPVDPSVALEAAARRVVEEAERRAEEIKELAGVLSRMTGSSTPAGVRLVSGLRVAMAEAGRIVARCRGEVLFMVYKAAEEAEKLWPLIEGVLAPLQGRARVLVYRKVAVREWALRELERLGVEVRSSSAPILDLMIACDTVMVGVPGLGDVVAVVVENREFAEGVRRRFEEAWREATPLNRPWLRR